MKKTAKNTLQSIVSLSALTLAGLYALPADAQTLSCPQPMNFGQFSITCGASSTVTVRPDSTRSVSGCLSATPAPFSEGSCTVSQSFPFQSIQITAPASDLITRTAGAQTMVINAFNLVTNANGRTYTTSSPFLTIPVGATLTTGAAPTGGRYEGQFTITAVFQ